MRQCLYISIIFTIFLTLNAQANESSHDCFFSLGNTDSADRYIPTGFRTYQNRTILLYISELKNKIAAQKAHEQARLKIDQAARENGRGSQEHRKSIREWEQTETELRAAIIAYKKQADTLIYELDRQLIGKSITVESLENRTLVKGQFIGVEISDPPSLWIEDESGRHQLFLDQFDWSSMLLKLPNTDPNQFK